MPTRERLTDRQQQVLEFIQTKITRDGYPPTIREIGDHLGIRSTNGVNDHLKALARISRLLRENDTIAKLRGTDTAEGLYSILTEPSAAASAA